MAGEQRARVAVVVVLGVVEREREQRACRRRTADEARVL
jgi:hypothetical protein